MTERLVSLDLLRGVAAYAVAVPHILLLFVPRQRHILEGTAVLAVEVFFVLSGYVLAPQLLKCFEAARHIPIFLMRRWMRTVPPYLLALVVMALVAGTLGSDDFLRYVVYVQNFFYQANAIDFYSVAWSLSVEEWFYVAFPVALLAASRFVAPNRRSALSVALLFIAVVTVARLALGDLDNWSEQVRRVVIFRVDSIAYGFVLYLLLPRGGDKHATVALCIVLPMATLDLALIAEGNRLAMLAFPFLSAALGSCLVLVARGYEHRIEARPWLVWTSVTSGRISYLVYLFHLPVASLAINSLPGTPLIILASGIVLTTTVLAWVLHHSFERPILAARPRYKP